MDGTWTNLGTEFLEFNGQSVPYSWQESDADGNPMVRSESFDAVSGKGQDIDYWNVDRTFDYSEERQAQANMGPTPEGLYSINKKPFAEGTNESGFARYSDLSLLGQAAAQVGRSNWPGGTKSWGDYRWKLQFEDARKVLEYGR